MSEQLDKMADEIRRMQRNTVKGRGVLLCRNIMQNLGQSVGMRSLTRMRGALSGVPMFIVSAGPSLDNNAHLLHEAKKRGLLSVVNTAAPTLSKLGLNAHMQINVEPMELSSWHGDNIEGVVAGLSSNPKTFQLSKKSDGPMLITASPHLMRVCTTLEEEPLNYGGAVATAAFAAGIVLGCDPIVLVGQDLAYDIERGKAYAGASAWGGMTAKLTDDGKIEFGGKDQEDRRALHAAHRAPIPGNQRDSYAVPRYGGNGEVYTTTEFESQRRFFMDWAKVFGRNGRRFINASEGGSRLEGWEELTLAEVLSQHPVRMSATEPFFDKRDDWRITKEAMQALKASLLDECDRAEAFAVGMIDGDLDNPRVAAMMKSCPFLWGFSAADTIGIHDSEDMTLPMKQRGKYEIWRHAAKEIRDAIKEWDV